MDTTVEPLRVCRKCTKEKPVGLFKKGRGGVPEYTCKKCNSEYVSRRFKARSALDPGLMQKQIAYEKVRHAKQRQIVLDHYGRICVCCEEANEKFLTVDHIVEIGSKAKRQESGHNRIYNWLIQNNFPDGFRILCYNCNCGRAHNGGICPHQEGSQARAQARSHKCGEVPEIRKDQEMVESGVSASAVLCGGRRDYFADWIQ